MIQALDIDFGNLLAAVDLSKTLVIITSDNGSDSEAIRNQRWKYVRTTDNVKALFDLQADRPGNTNLFPVQAGTEAGLALEELERELEELRPGGLLSICTRIPLGQECNEPGEDLECCSEACGGAVLQCSLPGFPPEEPACQ
jgi:hypothetical protein